VPTAQLELLFDKLAAEDGTSVRAAPMPSPKVPALLCRASA
jgi:hypothetical protein